MTTNAFMLRQAGPSPALRGIALSYWEAAGTLGHSREKVLPRAEVLLCINLGDAQALVDDAGGRRLYSDAWIVGLQRSALVTEALGVNWLCGARLRPEGALQLLGGAAAAAAGDVVPLDDAFPHWTAALIAEVRAASTPAARFAAIDRALCARLQAPSARQSAIAYAARKLGDQSVARLADEIGWSRQRLHERFVCDIGLSPKRYQRLVRFEQALRLLHRPQARFVAVANSSGYFDEAHFAREFRAFAGLPPRAYLQARLDVEDYGFASAD